MTKHFGLDLGVDFGRALRERRKAAGRTQTDVAKHLGMHPQAIARIEGGRRNSSIATIQDLARELGLELLLVPKASLPALKAVLANNSSNDEKGRFD